MSKGEVRLVNGRRVATPEYRSWQMMKNRCNNPRARDYAHYGGRGIRVCRRWETFDNFLADMGRRPTLQHTLERKNSDKNYCPSNCVWATRADQARNRGYARTKAWLLAEALGVSAKQAAHAIWQVRAKDANRGQRFDLSPAREALVRKHLEKYCGGTV